MRLVKKCRVKLNTLKLMKKVRWVWMHRDSVATQHGSLQLKDLVVSLTLSPVQPSVKAIVFIYITFSLHRSMLASKEPRTMQKRATCEIKTNILPLRNPSSPPRHKEQSPLLSNWLQIIRGIQCRLKGESLYQ
jgi:hypothetical protein